MFLASVGSGLDPASSGRQMPSHWCDPRLNIFTTSSPTGSQCLQAAGAAEALLRARQGGLEERLGMEPDEVVLASLGDGAAAEGEFWESLNAAVNLRLPLVFLVQDNGYAISVPTDVQYPGGNVAALLKGWEDHGLLVVDAVDGLDPIASFEAMALAVDHARARRGPALVRARVIRPYSHSLSDDEQLYKTAAQRAEEGRRDPFTAYPARLLELGDLTAAGLEQMKAEVQGEVVEAEVGGDAPGGELAAVEGHVAKALTGGARGMKRGRF